LIFLSDANLALGNAFLVNVSITKDVCGPDTRTTAIPETPGPVDKAYIVIQ